MKKKIIFILTALTAALVLIFSGILLFRQNLPGACRILPFQSAFPLCRPAISSQPTT